jgi:RNA polymerase sigma-70 factor (ECF subfamily)
MDFSSLYRRYASDVHRFALFLSGNAALAEDLTAETFVRALVAQDTLRVDTVKAYLMAIARNLYIDTLRRESRLESIDGIMEPSDPGPRPDASAEGRLRLEEVLDAMQRLPQREREALVLAIDRDLPYERVAAILGCSVPTVKVRVHRARANLRLILEEERTCSTSPAK